MGIIDTIIYISIAIMYNLFVHNLASISYKDSQYEEKHQNTIIMLILFGGIGILISKMIDNKNKKNNSLVSKGLYYGSILLLLTALVANWESIMEEMKLFIIGGVFGCLLWYGYNRENDLNEKMEKDKQINEKILNELVNE